MNRNAISEAALAVVLAWQLGGLIVEPAAAQGQYAGSGRNGRELLDQILSSRSLPPTRENIAGVLLLLRSDVTPDEQVALTRVLGSLYPGADDPQAKFEIESYLSATARSTNDRVLGRAATLTYSRLGYFPDSLAVLAHARSAGFINDNDKFGDIAHLLPAAPASEQARLLKLLDEGNNGYSREILANLLKNREILRGLTPAAAALAAGVLGRFEPAFSGPANALGGGELLRYEDWLCANVALNAQISGQPERIIMGRTLKIDNADPRKLIAALSSESTSDVVRAAFDRRSLEKIDTAIATFAKQNSANPFIQEVAGMARGNLAGSGR